MNTASFIASPPTRLSSWGANTITGSTDDCTYLARQQLVFSFHRGFSTPVNWIGQVRVLTSLSGKSDGPNVKDGIASPGMKVTLTFEGFLKSVPVQVPE